MYDIVFVVPHKGTRTQSVNRKSGDLVPEFTVAETAMAAIMHHVKANGCRKSAH